MKKWMYNALIVLFAAVMVISAGCLIWYYLDGYLQESRYDALSDLHPDVTPRPTVGTSLEDSTAPTEPDPNTLVEVLDPETKEPVLVLPEFAQLYAMNNDIVGWLRIPGTPIDYPVMQTPDKPDYYLRRSFDKTKSTRGCLYARESCDIFAPSDNITIYGHRMREGSMFARLDAYLEEDFYRENPYIYFDHLRELHTYQVFSVFYTTASVGEGFAYHLFENAENEAQFDEFVAQCRELSLYDTGVEAAFGDKFITLSTCEKSFVNGRLVVVAKRIA